jgi:pantoate--beta-alanine ligase
MKIAHSIEELTNNILSWKKESKSIGFVPTMGFLHNGHLELVRNSKENTDKTVVSIFVNPAQFNDPEDYLKYPMDIDGDLEKCKEAGVDLVFLPSKEIFYPEGRGSVVITQELLQKNLCGRTRPGHFEGVMLVVAKLFHLVSPDKAYFGLKDYQQFRIIEDMVRLLNFPLTVHGVATLREKDGLAMSSRNVRLSEKERETASLIPRMYALAESVIANGEKNVITFHEILADFLLSASNLKIDYIETVDPEGLQEIQSLDSPFVLAVAVFVGNTRLIDNKLIQSKNTK